MTAEQLDKSSHEEATSDDVESSAEQTSEHIEDSSEVTTKEPEAAVETPAVEDIRETVEQEADAAERPDPEAETAPDEATSLPPANKALKAQTLNQTLKKTRQQLSKPQKTLSKVIHQPQIDAISDVTGKTIARPSGLFFGGLFALIGSLLYLFLSYRYHFAYKYIAFSLFFIGGFIIGLLVEFLGKLFKRRRTESS